MSYVVPTSQVAEKKVTDYRGPRNGFGYDSDEDDYHEPDLTQGGVVHSQGRGRVIGNQQVVVGQGRCHKDEIEIRKRECARLSPSQILAPPADNPIYFSTNKGVIGFLVHDNHRPTRGIPESDQGARTRFVGNMAGLARTVRLRLPVICLTERDASNPNSEDRITFMISGTNTVVHTGAQPQIHLGALLVADRNPAKTKVDRVTKPMIEIKGLPGVYHPQTRSMETSDVAALASAHKRRILARLSHPEKRRKFEGAAGWKPLHDLLVGEVNTSCDEDTWSDDLPLRMYLTIWLPWHLLKLARVPTSGVPHGAELRLRFALLKVLHLALSDASRVHADAIKNYEQFAGRGYTGAPDGKHTLQSPALRDLLDVAKLNRLTEPEARRQLDEAECRLDLFYSEHAEVMLHDTYAWLRTFTLGIALSSATRGSPMDILLGYGRV